MYCVLRTLESFKEKKMSYSLKKKIPLSHTVPRSQQLFNRCLLTELMKNKRLICLYISGSHHSSLAAEKFHRFIRQN